MSLPCPACGFLTVDEDCYGTFNICPICSWEDDAAQLANPACGGGANGNSLIDAQRAALAKYPLTMSNAVRIERDKRWRPLNAVERSMAESEKKAKIWMHRAIWDPTGVYWNQPKPSYVIDGNDFTTLEEFFEVISRVLIPDAEWGHNLDAFNDILRGGFGTPEGGFVIRWLNSQKSKEVLGYLETVRQLNSRLQLSHPSCDPSIYEQLAAAKTGRGPTVYDWLLEIIRVHCADGEEFEDGIELLLE